MATTAFNFEGTEYAVPCLWLRINDPGSITINGQRKFEISDVVGSPEAARVCKTVQDKDGSLTVTWGDGVGSLFPAAWLRRHVQTPQPGEGGGVEGSGAGVHLWQSNLISFLPEVDFADLSASTASATGNKKRKTGTENGAASDADVPRGLLKLSAFLSRYGIAVIRNVPVKAGMVEEVGNTVGFTRTTNYGSVFDVIDLGSAGNNLAQTNVRILAHTDNPYRDPFPGLQLLHCLARAGSGGCTNFTDGFAAAEELRRTDPAAFRLLAAHRLPFEYRDPTTQVLLRAEAPVLTVEKGGADSSSSDAAAGKLKRITFNNRSAAALPAEHPLMASPALLEAYYAAYAKFDALCNADRFVLRILMSPGDLCIFQNSRVMHGRDEYVSARALPAGGVGRHIQGCYVDHDGPRSRIDWAAFVAANAAQPTAERDLHRSFDVHWMTTQDVMSALATQEGFMYGEGVNMLEHALQAANCAVKQGESNECVLACLMHDVGNTIAARDAWRDETGDEPPLLMSPDGQPIGYSKHSDMSGCYLRTMGFSEAVHSACALHVSAKRALVAMDPAYYKELSQASVDTLKHQGGPLSPSELTAFRARPGADVALRLRRCDDEAKIPNLVVPRLKAYETMIYKHLVEQSAAK